jgi:hypothetical protein
VSRVIAFGVSAGGYGATFSWSRVQQAFPAARVDVFNDPGLMIDPAPQLFATMVEAWGLAAPPDCSDCTKRLSAWLPYYATHLTAPRRYAMLGFLGDGQQLAFFGVPAERVEHDLLAVRSQAAPNQKTFFLRGTGHIVLQDGSDLSTASGVTLAQWRTSFFADDPDWQHAGP